MDFLYSDTNSFWHENNKRAVDTSPIILDLEILSIAFLVGTKKDRFSICAELHG